MGRNEGPIKSFVARFQLNSLKKFSCSKMLSIKLFCQVQVLLLDTLYSFLSKLMTVCVIDKRQEIEVEKTHCGIFIVRASM